MSQQTHSFSIAGKTSDLTGQPFGEKYAGTFTVRRPSVKDKTEVALLEASRLSKYGAEASSLVPNGIKFLNYIFSYFAVCGQQVPEWFAEDKTVEDSDEAAVFAAWDEVNNWLDSFRSKAGRGEGESTV